MYISIWVYFSVYLVLPSITNSILFLHQMEKFVQVGCRHWWSESKIFLHASTYEHLILFLSVCAFYLFFFLFHRSHSLLQVLDLDVAYRIYFLSSQDIGVGRIETYFLTGKNAILGYLHPLHSSCLCIVAAFQVFSSHLIFLFLLWFASWLCCVCVRWQPTVDLEMNV